MPGPPAHPPRGGRVAMRTHVWRVCGASAGTSARARVSCRAARRHHFRGSRPRRQNIIPRSPPMRRASPPPRARALPTRARRLLGAARRPPRENLRSETAPVRRASPLLRARATQWREGAAWRRAPTPARNKKSYVFRHACQSSPARASAAQSREESARRRAPTPARKSQSHSRAVRAILQTRSGTPMPGVAQRCIRGVATHVIFPV